MEADQIMSLCFYSSYNHSIFDFASVVYTYLGTKWKLDRLQYKALSIITGASESAPTQSLLAECETPLNIRREFLAHRYLVENISFSNTSLTQRISIVSM